MQAPLRARRERRAFRQSSVSWSGLRRGAVLYVRPAWLTWPARPTSPLRVRNAELAHAAQPAIVVGALPAKIFSDFGVRKNQEAFLRKSFDHIVRDLLRLDRAVEEKRAAAGRGAVQHVGADALRTQRRDLDAAIAVRDRQPFGECERGVLGDRVGRRLNVREQPGSGHRLQQITFT